MKHDDEMEIYERIMRTASRAHDEWENEDNTVSVRAAWKKVTELLDKAANIAEGL